MQKQIGIVLLEGEQPLYCRYNHTVCMVTVFKYTLRSFSNASHIHSSKQDDPGIAAHPKSQKCFPGETVTFRIEARGETQLTFRWLHGECVLKGADGPVLTLTEVSDCERGVYMCEVENESGKVSCEVAELEVGRFTAQYILHNYLLVSIPDLYLP